MKFLNWSDIPKDARIVALPFTHDSITMRMKIPDGNAEHIMPKRKQVEKIIVPPRAERYEDMGDPKAPKMGKIKPTKIELPEVDDLLEKLKKITTAPMEFAKCHVGCRCLPCLQAACNGCHVERHRDDPDRTLVRQLVAQYRG